MSEVALNRATCDVCGWWMADTTDEPGLLAEAAEQHMARHRRDDE